MIAEIDWASVLVAGVFVLAGITTWMWGHHVGVTRGRKIEQDLTAMREEQRRRET